jgi:hypothetical protein
LQYCIIIFVLCKIYSIATSIHMSLSYKQKKKNTYMSLCYQLFVAFIYIYIYMRHSEIIFLKAIGPSSFLSYDTFL